jgi:pyruvate dehydrogenase E2 component (dihydrolipoamide acetyltransferase)
VLQGVRMPALGQTTDELRIVEWRKKEGDPVEQGEPLFSVETDKATLEVEAFSSGILRKIVHQADDVVEVGTLVAYIGQLDDSLPEEPFEQAAPEAASALAVPKLASGAEARVTSTLPGVASTLPSEHDKPLASPAVRALMREHGIDPRQVRGSGPGGRIERRDVETLLQQTAEIAADTAQSLLTPVPRHRRIIAERLTRSVHTIPQIAVTAVLDMRHAQATLLAKRARGISRLTYTHLVLRAVAQTLRQQPRLNTLWESTGPQFRRLVQTNVGLVVASGDALLVVTIPEPDRMPLDELVSVTDAAIERGRTGVQVAGDMAPAAFTISNLGMYGVDSFTAIVDPAQTAILALGVVADQPLVVDGELHIVPQMKTTLVVDHRVADGVAAALFLRALGEALDDPAGQPERRLLQ